MQHRFRQHAKRRQKKGKAQEALGATQPPEPAKA